MEGDAEKKHAACWGTILLPMDDVWDDIPHACFKVCIASLSITAKSFSGLSYVALVLVSECYGNGKLSGLDTFSHHFKLSARTKHHSDAIERDALWCFVPALIADLFCGSVEKVCGTAHRSTTFLA